MPNTTLVTTDVENLLHQVQDELRNLEERTTPVRFHMPEVTPTDSSSTEDRPIMARLTDRLATLRSLHPELLRHADAVGEPPPSPVTFRARIGAAFIRFAGRFLWWQTWALKRYAANVNSVLSEHLQALEDTQQANSGMLDLMSRHSQQLRALEVTLRAESQRLRSMSLHLDHIPAKLEFAEREQHKLQSLLDANRAENLRANDEIREIREAVSKLHSAVEDVRAAVVSAEPSQGTIRSLEQQVAVLHQRSIELTAEAQQMKTEHIVQGSRIAFFLEEVRRRLTEPLTQPEMQRLLSEDAHRFDALYLAFENVFRGSREDVKRRQSVYLPALKDARAAQSLGPVLDLGCGRGEWLELMRENQIAASGVDLNRSMLELCRSLGFDVIESDALAHLRSIDDSKLGVVTCFHMVEHLPFEVLIAIIDECVRVLQPGGLLLFETPNPHNMLVGSYTFYMDPTHRNLLPAPMLRFFVEARGFVASEILEINPYPVSAQLDDRDNPIVKELNQRFFGPQDYGIIARRP